jgi:hypothetical protein
MAISTLGLFLEVSAELLMFSAQSIRDMSTARGQILDIIIHFILSRQVGEILLFSGNLYNVYYTSFWVI